MPGIVIRPTTKRYSRNAEKRVHRAPKGTRCHGDVMRQCPQRPTRKWKGSGEWMCDRHWWRYKRYGRDVVHMPWGAGETGEEDESGQVEKTRRKIAVPGSSIKRLPRAVTKMKKKGKGTQQS